MRVALLAWDYPPSPSGLSVAAREIAESLGEAGCDVTVFTADRAGREQAGGIAIVGCQPGRSLAGLRRWAVGGHLAAPLAFRRAVLAEHGRAPFTVIEATNWYAPAALLTGGPAPLVVRNSTPAAFSRGDDAPSLRNRMDGRFADWLEARTARAAAGLISNTGAHRERIETAYGLSGSRRPHAVVGLSLPPAMLARAAAAPILAREAGEPLRLLFVGRAERRKGFDLICEAVSRLAADPQTADRFRIDMVGVSTEDLPAAMPEPARAHLDPLGRRPFDELAGRYEGAHAVLAPSRYESFGLVYQEALAYGRPVVGCGEDASAREFIGETGAGLLTANASGAELADCIARLVHDDDLRLGLAKTARAAAGRFTRQTLAAETLALYREALSPA